MQKEFLDNSIVIFTAEKDSKKWMIRNFTDSFILVSLNDDFSTELVASIGSKRGFLFNLIKPVDKIYVKGDGSGEVQASQF